MPHLPDAIGALERDLRDVFRERLQSIVAYGLHARKERAPHDHGVHDDEGRGLAQTLVVVENIVHDDLRACAVRAASWHEGGLATPLVLAAQEFARSLDVFPLEFGAILADHTIVFGKNPFDGLNVDANDLRRACEVQARSHLLHLREGYIETRGRGDALAVLIVRSAPAFAALLQSIARLQGVTAHDPESAGRHAERTLAVPGGIVSDVVKFASVTEISSADAQRLFPAYLDATTRLVGYVDGWSRR